MQISSAVIHFSQTVQTAAVQQAEAAAAQVNIYIHVLMTERVFLFEKEKDPHFKRVLNNSELISFFKQMIADIRVVSHNSVGTFLNQFIHLIHLVNIPIADSDIQAR